MQWLRVLYFFFYCGLLSVCMKENMALEAHHTLLPFATGGTWPSAHILPTRCRHLFIPRQMGDFDPILDMGSRGKEFSWPDCISTLEIIQVKPPCNWPASTVLAAMRCCGNHLKAREFHTSIWPVTSLTDLDSDGVDCNWLFAVLVGISPFSVVMCSFFFFFFSHC